MYTVLGEFFRLARKVCIRVCGAFVIANEALHIEAEADALLDDVFHVAKVIETVEHLEAVDTIATQCLQKQRLHVVALRLPAPKIAGAHKYVEARLRRLVTEKPHPLPRI